MFNRVVTLRDTWAKITDAGKGGGEGGGEGGGKAQKSGPTPVVPALDGAALEKLVSEVRAQGGIVRDLKAGGGDAADAIRLLLELKERLPDGHELKGGKKKKRR